MSDTIIWEDNETPVAVRFDDPYYSKKDGRAETRHVFVEGNQLPDRFAACETFHVAELGFGTALNFLETVQTWQQNAPENARLIYTSFELYPLSKQDMTRALTPWPDLLALATPFLEQLSLQSGVNEMAQENITLRLVIGDANDTVPQTTTPVDAWHLDGFSPAKNPELWNAELMQSVGQQTKPEGTFATYTAAGWVRRMLDEAGFDVERVKGFGTKRHMSVGTKRS
ncbi:MAG: tRNA (5-methylaminomethyl-2-thiouridine)(34)-methyltransferase MnmD [Hyphomicrobiales bacterium]